MYMQMIFCNEIYHHTTRIQLKSFVFQKGTKCRALFYIPILAIDGKSYYQWHEFMNSKHLVS